MGTFLEQVPNGSLLISRLCDIILSNMRVINTLLAEFMHGKLTQKCSRLNSTN